jgi:hypothetical protein
MDTKFCELCDADYDWACPECPSCVARESYYKLLEEKGDIHKRFSLAKAVIDALPNCNNCYKQKATRYEIFQEYNKFSENYYNDHVWRCDDCGPQIYELNYAAALREFLKLSGT